ncbi:MAG: TIGR04282 family arsenosugar biosynthesis glycosyltransferase [Burkholderiales bacterium]|nr:TIGR04282 family arsenosugar biosynthesis glycosyltransferase [Burkholderiales bacterium]
MKAVRIVIIAKAPLAGFAKTRLIPALGSQGAAALARRLLAHTLSCALDARLGQVELCVTPSALDTVWQTLPVSEDMRAALHWSEQGEGDLGVRLVRAAQRTIEGGESVLLIGTDCPALGATELQQAALALQSADATLFPTADGGYALLGLKRFHPSLFEGIAWSTDSVAFETLCRIARLGWSVQSHPMLHDIDEPADLKWLPQDWLEENPAWQLAEDRTPLARSV